MKLDMASSKLDVILPALRAVVPPLSASRYKGQAGKVAVVGGCREYTGAPYFSAISALKVGADLSHVFCTQGAATVIKSYSPELIVHPILEESHDVKGERQEVQKKVLCEIGKWLDRFDCLVIGPGLGRDPFLLDCVSEIIQEAKAKEIPLVIDGDGLFLITNSPELVCGYSSAILTPNVNEHKRLVAKMADVDGEAPALPNDVNGEDLASQLKELAKKMGGITIVQKGNVDHISDGISVLSSDFFGSPRRCGGQGDVLSGSIGAFMAWSRAFFMTGGNDNVKVFVEERLSKNPALVAAMAGSLLVRKTASEAYLQKKRSMVTGDLIEVIGKSMEELFPAVEEKPLIVLFEAL
ncbi:hypothetical protein GOP47_0008661 [Adiantum capillus-veneris]|uniref:ATP-dependent (S)-NAD(P)H-hydrate dehydratase n=1 Tax=Adiantum capillus-veneris TaxID=13818 RepID=A0A9D4UZA0_ADICA|nr:hypothetical protein GOP47_0008661 [Adiantum capillus-veneris]